MSDITLVRQQRTQIDPKHAAIAREFFFGQIDGLGEKGRKQWRRFVNGLLKLEPGEMVEIKTHKARVGLHHRRHMLLESRVFEAQERITAFDDFRLWLKLGAGHVTWMAGPKGGVVPVPRSISYSALEEGEMQELHDRMVEFLRSDHAGKYLWPHLTVAQRIDAIESVLQELHE